MGLTKQQKELTVSTWKRAKELGGGHVHFGRDILARLLEITPEAQNLFPFKDEPLEELKTSTKLGCYGSNFTVQVEKVTLGIDSLYGSVGPNLVGLGVRHYGYGAREENYPALGQALFETMEKLLGADYTPEVHAAWNALWDFITEAMLEGSNNH